MRPVILLDCDGVLADFGAGYLGAFVEETGDVVGTDQIDRWDMHKCTFFIKAAEAIGVTTTELRRRVDAHVSRPGFCSSLAVTHGALSAVERLREIGDVYVVTAPWDSSVTWMHERAHWIHRKLGIPRSHVIQAARKHLIAGDVFVDDKASHVAEWAERWPQGHSILFDLPHNQDASGVRRGGWADVIAAARVASIAVNGPQAMEVA